jgi:hypothetical protein
MKRALLALLALASSLAAVFLTLTWRMRAAMPYNSEGRHFDAAQAVVYHEQAVAIYAALALSGWALAALAAWGAFRR